jgi:Transposase
VKVRLGIDVACRADHQASLAGVDGEFIWSGWRFRTTPTDLGALWEKIPAGAEVQVIVEPTRNAWVPLAAWLSARGAEVVLVAPEQSADLRDYYNKHTKTDRLDSRVLARLPLLHPEGLAAYDGPTPADPLRRVMRRRAKLVKARVATFQRIDALVELLGPTWAEVLGAGDYTKTALVVLERYGDPRALRRLGSRRLSELMIKTSKGAWRDDKAAALLAAADEAMALWAGGGIDFAELAADIAAEVRVARSLNDEIAVLEQRAAPMFAAADRQPAIDDGDDRGIIASVPGLGGVLGAGILAASVTSTASPTWPESGRSPGSSPRSTSPASPTATTASPRPAIPGCARRSTSPPTTCAASTRSSPPATTVSSSRPASTTTRRCATSPPPWPPAWRPAGADTSATRCATSTAPRSRRPRAERSSPSATRSPTTCAKPGAAPRTPSSSSSGRPGAERSRRRPLRRRAEPPTTVARRSRDGLDYR